MDWRWVRHGIAGGMVLLGMVCASWGQEAGKPKENRFWGALVGVTENALVLRSGEKSKSDFLVPIQENTQIYIENVLVDMKEVSAWGQAAVIQSDGLTTRVDIRSAKWGKDPEENEKRPIVQGQVTKVEKDKLTFRANFGGIVKEATVTVEEDTVIKAEGAKVAYSKVTVGASVSVVRKDGKATRITVLPTPVRRK